MIVLIKLIKKLFGTGRAQIFGNQAIDLHLIELNRQSHLPRQDDQFPGDVDTREILARVGLSKALGMGLAHDLGKSAGAVERVKDIRECAGEYSFYADDPIAGFE